ncbi:MAG: hypothetical protein OXN97_22575 [Bryobacterales bacterium]|nr:hypothetical protein [Bryobacterales bacterium]
MSDGLDGYKCRLAEVEISVLAHGADSARVLLTPRWSYTHLVQP